MIDNLSLLFFGTFLLAAPFIAAALGGLFSERSGVINIGLEGMMIFGAFIGTITVLLLGFNFPDFPFPIMMGCITAMLGGALFALIHAYLTISLKIDQIISGVVINTIALAISIYITKIMFGVNETERFQTIIPTIGTTKITYITIVILILPFIVYFIINKTRWGLRIRAVGENPQAADAMGINVVRVRYQAVITSGILAGLAGMALILNVQPKFTPITVAGSGFIAIAVLIFGRHRALGVLIAGIIFGFFKQLGIISLVNPPSIPFTNFEIPVFFFNALPYIVTIVVLILFSRGKKMEMESLGKPYDKEVR